MPTLAPLIIKIFARDNVSTGLQKSMRQMSRFGKSARKTGKSMSLFLTAPIVAAGAASVNAFNSLNSSMANVATLIPGRQKRILELRDSVEDLAVETGKSAGDISEGLFQVISAFGDTADTVKRLDVVARAAVAGRATTIESLNLLSAVTKGYGDTTVEAVEKAANLAFLTNKLGQTTFPEMAASMGKVIATANTMNVSQEELFATMATLTGVTGKTAEVTTQLRAIMNSFVGGSGDMAKTIKQLGFNSGEAMIKQLGLVGSMKKVIGTTDGLSGQIKALFPSQEAFGAIMELTSNSNEKFNKSLKAMQTESGAAKAAYKEQTEGINKLGFSMSRAGQVMAKMSRQIGAKLAPHVIKATAFISNLGRKFLALSPFMKKSGLIIAAIVLVIGPLILAAGAIAAAISFLVPIFSGITGAIVLGIAAFTGIMFVMNKLLSIGGPLGTAIKILLLAFAPMITIPLLIIKNWDKVVSFFKSAGGFFKGVGKFIGGLFSGKEESSGLNFQARSPKDLLGVGGSSKAAELGRQTIANQASTSKVTGKMDINLRGLPAGSDVRTSSQDMEIMVRRGAIGAF